MDRWDPKNAWDTSIVNDVPLVRLTRSAAVGTTASTVYEACDNSHKTNSDKTPLETFLHMFFKTEIWESQTLNS
jgi:hypothetical protein